MLAGIALAAPAAGAASPELLRPYDGQNPFKCELQRVGTGTEFSDPEADPLCVEYDKTNQNVSDLGIVDFVLAEPARVAVASDNCFYYQHDHWTGSLNQGQPPELWHWDGGYFFDKGSGLGGVYFENARLGGQGPPAAFLELLPDELAAYAHPTGFGALLDLGQGIDPKCAAMVDTPAERARIYRKPSQYPGRDAGRSGG